jgi:hypothetical protein
MCLMSYSYDNWKTVDKECETEQENYEKVEEAIEKYGCSVCKNKAPEEFTDFHYLDWTERGKGGQRYKCDVMKATCKKCGTEFKHGHEPDWDSMSEGHDDI